MKKVLSILGLGLLLMSCDYDPSDVRDVSVKEIVRENVDMSFKQDSTLQYKFIDDSSRELVFQKQDNGEIKLIKSYETDFTGRLVFAFFIAGTFVFFLNLLSI